MYVSYTRKRPLWALLWAVFIQPFGLYKRLKILNRYSHTISHTINTYYIHTIIYTYYIHIIYSCYMHATDILYTYYIHTIYMPCAYYIHTIYLLYTYYIHTIYMLYAYYIQSNTKVVLLLKSLFLKVIPKRYYF